MSVIDSKPDRMRFAIVETISGVEVAVVRRLAVTNKEVEPGFILVNAEGLALESGKAALRRHLDLDE